MIVQDAAGAPIGVVYQQVRETDDSWGGTADISLQKRGELLTTTVGYNRSLSYNIFGEPIERDRFYAAVSARLSELLTAGVSGSFYLSKTEGRFENTDGRYFDVSPYLSYRIMEDHLLSVYYIYANEEDRTLTVNPDRERNRVWIVLRSQFPKDWSY
jgi:hypothetical protein